MKCAIYGAGSLGTVLGAYMSRAGQEVELVNHDAGKSYFSTGNVRPI